MSQNRNMKKSEGMCQKIRSAIRRLSPPPPVHVVHQPNFSRTIPIESEPNIAHIPAKTEAVVANGGRAATSDSRKAKQVTFKKAKSKKHGDPMHEGIHEDPDYMFSDYINKVKRRMINTVSSVRNGDNWKSK